MRALLLPVKDLQNSKQRLAAVLTPEERFGLVQAMLADTVRAIRSTTGAARILVVTSYEPAMRMAHENGWEILREDQQLSESDSVDAASRICESWGITGLLRIPLDIPLVQARDFDELFAIECHAPALVIVPSRDGTGTNAMFRTPPTLFPSHFGDGSFVKHILEAEKAGARVIIRNNPRLELDVDDEADLRMLLGQNTSNTETGRWLRESGVESRFRPHAKARIKSAAKV
jgi:2-phospho-L-lactate/phosphoenolpyruvate guanylyltransferase